jgi:hypothetical protein
MGADNENTMKKKKYIKPRIEWIPLDNEISLALESTPPIGPSEGFNYNSNNPFNNQPQNIILS